MATLTSGIWCLTFLVISNTAAKLSTGENDICTIVIQRGEYFRPTKNRTLNLRCDIGSYRQKGNVDDNDNIIPYILENNRKMNISNSKNNKSQNTTLYVVNAIKDNTYACGISEDYNGLENMKKIKIEDHPLPVKHFRCYSYDFDYWKCKFQSIDRIPVNYTLTYVPFDESPHFYNCRFLSTTTSPNYECQAKNYRKTYSNFTFNLKASNCFAEQRTIRKKIQQNQYVVPADVNLHVVNTTFNSVTLKWTFETSYWTLYNENDEKGLVYIIEYKSEYDINWQIFDKHNRTFEVPNYIQLNNLQAFTRYEAKIKVKAATAKNIPKLWKSCTTTFRTAATIPSTPPTVDIGGYYLSNDRNITIYWKKISRHQINAESVTYIVDVIYEDERTSETIETSDHYIIYKAENTGHYKFMIQSKNSEGVSKESNEIVILISDQNDDFPKPGSLRTSYNGLYTVEWEAPSDRDKFKSLIGYTIFTCSAKQLSFDFCESPLNFSHVPVNQTLIEIKPETTDLIFAVSANYQNGSSGMLTTLCIPNEKSELSALNPKIVSTTDTSIKLQWSWACEQRTLIRSLTLQYCIAGNESNGCTEESVVNVTDIGADKSEYIVSGLRPFMKYLMIVTYKTRQQPSISIFLTGHTREAAPSMPRNLRLCQISESSAVIEWDSPEFPNGHVKFYEISLNESDLTTNDEVMSYTFSGLKPYQIYDIRLQAVTMRGSEKLIGVPSDRLLIRTKYQGPDLTENFEISNNDSTINLSWNSPTKGFDVKFEAIIYELKWTKGESWEYATTNLTSYSFNSICDKKQIYLRPVLLQPEFDSFNNFGKCKTNNWTMPKNYSEKFTRTNGKWYLAFKEDCYASNSETILLITIISILLMALVVVSTSIPMLLYKKYQRMKDICAILPTKLTDKYDNDNSKFDFESDKEIFKHEHTTLVSNVDRYEENQENVIMLLEYNKMLDYNGQQRDVPSENFSKLYPYQQNAWETCLDDKSASTASLKQLSSDSGISSSMNNIDRNTHQTYEIQRINQAGYVIVHAPPTVSYQSLQKRNSPVSFVPSAGGLSGYVTLEQLAVLENHSKNYCG